MADTSLPYDRTLKLRAYARSSVPVYWIVNLNAHVLEVFTEPTGSGAQAFYRQHRIYEPDDEVPLTLDGREIARLTVRDILP